MFLRFIAIFFVLDIIVCCFGKELELHGSPSLSKLILKRHKRLRSNYGDGHNAELDSESRNHDESGTACSPKKASPRFNTIIRSSASIENGANYLSARNGTSSTECFNMCCQDPACDTAIYEDKGDRRCYLFNCHGLCKFKDHNNYAVWDIQHQVGSPAPPPPEEEELAHLHNDNKQQSHDRDDDNKGHHPADDDGDDNDDKNSDYDSNESSQEGDNSARKDSRDDDDGNREQSQTHVHKSKPVYVAPHTAGLSEYCQSDVSCEDPNAGCFRQTCHCKDGYYSKNGLCRKICSQSEFECFALGTSGRGPECIPRSQICDSYMQCADGSDEFNCRNQDSVPRNNAASSAWMARPSPNRMNKPIDGRQTLPVRIQPVLQQGKFQQKLPASDHDAINLDTSTPSGKQQYNDYDDAISNSKIPQGYKDRSGNAMNLAPSVRPINRVLAHPVTAGLKDRKQLNTKDNQHVAGSFHNTNSNTYPQPTNTNNKATDNNHEFNQNNNLRGPPPRGNAFNTNRQDTKSYSSSYARKQNAPNQPFQPQPSHNQISNSPQEPSSQQHNPSNLAYSESGPLPLSDNENVQNTDTKLSQKQGTQRYNSQSVHSPLQGNSNSASHASDMSRVSHGRDGLKEEPSSSQQRIPSAMKNPLSSLPKPLSSQSQRKISKSQVIKSKSDAYKTHQNSMQSSSKVSSHDIQPAVRPKYPDSSILSASSSSHQPSRQSWLDGNPYLAYGSGAQRQRQQAPPTRNNQYYDPSQYFSQYNTDSLDSLPPSLLGDAGSQDDFSQFGGSYVDKQKPLNRMPYPIGGGGNSGYNTGYPDSPYNSQYNPPNRYNYGGGDFGGGNYQDADIYSSLRNAKDYQSQGLYEDEQSNHPVPNSNSGGIKSKGTFPLGNKASSPDDAQHNVHKSKGALSSVLKTTKTPVLVPKTSEIASTSSHEASSGSESVKNKTKIDGSASGSKFNLTHATTKKSHSSLSHNSNKVFLTQEKVIIASSSSEAEGPIIALSLGLAFTLILIGLLGCRLRNMKHRLRKGRPLNSNEADYLINGMYL